MTPSTTDTNLLLDVNRFAEQTSWLHGPMKAVANYGVFVFAALLVLGWVYARRQDIGKVVASVWAGAGTLVAVAVNQPLVHHFHEARPYTDLPGILVLAHRSADFSFPSDHATMAGAVTAGLFLVRPLFGYLSLGFALLMAFSRVYIAAHYPYDVLAGLLLGAAVVLVGYLVVRRPLTWLFEKLAETPLRPLVTDRLATSE